MLLRLYIKLLGLYPDQYRQHYTKQIRQTLQDILKHEPSKNKRHLILVKEILTLPLSAGEQYLITFSKQRHMSPKTIISLIALGLLIPFVIALLIDEISEFTTGGHLYNTWLWSRPVLLIWIVILPFISLVLALSTYLISLLRQRNKIHIGSLLAKRYWLPIVTIVFSVGILCLVVFHDTVHCWLVGVDARNIISCTESGLLGGDTH